ncbi:hypothetical protein BDK51DRAFT_28257 [Blyttiomyces helicus]|uniref:Transmembrane protein n=1 Tax=Blyttiomyces helicus TaxID=388810 RepID=A0A4P9W1Z0_9FUNG|nr:hypothetical protein BDK51DRAFT_28257 [Blyttiomyces helicus]|eukprot:RKO86221.1 hypothetical protein BDK51DRAFT_28257 [Blyttiomyces helicus]
MPLRTCTPSILLFLLLFVLPQIGAFPTTPSIHGRGRGGGSDNGFASEEEATPSTGGSYNGGSYASTKTQGSGNIPVWVGSVVIGVLVLGFGWCYVCKKRQMKR